MVCKRQGHFRNIIIRILEWIGLVKGSNYKVELLKSKLHGIRVTEANLHYRGSLTVDEALIEAAGMFAYEKILVVNNVNGERLETYLIKGARDSGVCCMNGAAAHKASVGHELIVMSFVTMNDAQAKRWKPRRVFINDKNKIDNIETD